jgi:hypothetical protein
MEAKRKRRWYQFRLRTLFVVLAIVAVQCAVCVPALKQWQRRRQNDIQLLPIRFRSHSPAFGKGSFSTSSGIGLTPAPQS